MNLRSDLVHPLSRVWLPRTKPLLQRQAHRARSMALPAAVAFVRILAKAVRVLGSPHVLLQHMIHRPAPSPFLAVLLVAALATVAGKAVAVLRVFRRTAVLVLMLGIAHRAMLQARSRL